MKLTIKQTLASLVLALSVGHSTMGAATELTTDVVTQTTPMVIPEAIQNLQRYYFGNVSEAPVLVDLQFCQGIHKAGRERHDCQNPLNKDQLVVGEPFYVWMNFLVPKGDGAKILVHLNHDGFTRTARAMDISSGIRYRTWTKLELNKAGEWKMPIYYETREGIRTLDDVTFNLI